MSMASVQCYSYVVLLQVRVFGIRVCVFDIRLGRSLPSGAPAAATESLHHATAARPAGTWGVLIQPASLTPLLDHL